MKIDDNKLAIFRSLFRGRSDTYAIRWEKEGSNGYMPAWDVDWGNYQAHKAKGGTFQDYPDKKKRLYNDEAIRSHLQGEEVCGIYPLLHDNTSFFVAVDFDKENWREAIRSLYSTSARYGLEGYMERSRSGNGGHLWFFFEEAYPAEQSRKIMFELLRHAGIISHFEKEPSFDRLFPNQDFHSGKGFGNLIALPLQGKSVNIGNTCFLNPETFEVYEDHWAFLETVERVSAEKMRSVYKELFTVEPSEVIP